MFINPLSSYTKPYLCSHLQIRPSSLIFFLASAPGAPSKNPISPPCSLADKLSSFYRNETGKATLKEQGLMTKWAKKAGALVFQDAEDLSDDNLVTFCNLSLFWHSQGSWRISYLHKGMPNPTNPDAFLVDFTR